jgi:hypothetical protein
VAALLVLVCRHANAQVLTVAGGQTTGAATKHDYASLEINLPWKEQVWQGERWAVDLNHAFSVSGFWDENNVYLVSWAPNLVLSWRGRDNWYPYVQAGFGIALLSDDRFESRDDDPYDDGTTDMGSYAQFESSLTLGIVYGQFGMRARIYHYSNGELASPNQGIDVAEFGFNYRF